MSYRVINSDEPIDRSQFPEDALWFFDFDGVLATQCEEKVFRLPAAEDERETLERIAKTVHIDPELYPSTGYLRHLVIQAIMPDAPEAHPAVLSLLRGLQRAAEPHFVITARSGYWAVERMMQFLRFQMIYPQEVFCLGRSSKADLLAKLRLDWPDRPFVFFEDSAHHLEACQAVGDPNLHIVEVRWPTCMARAEAIRGHFLGV